MNDKKGADLRKSGPTFGVMVSPSKYAATAAPGEPRSCASWLKRGREAGAKLRHAFMASSSAVGHADGNASSL